MMLSSSSALIAAIANEASACGVELEEISITAFNPEIGKWTLWITPNGSDGHRVMFSECSGYAVWNSELAEWFEYRTMTDVLTRSIA